MVKKPFLAVAITVSDVRVRCRSVEIARSIAKWETRARADREPTTPIDRGKAASDRAQQRSVRTFHFGQTLLLQQQRGGCLLLCLVVGSSVT